MSHNFSTLFRLSTLPLLKHRKKLVLGLAITITATSYYSYGPSPESLILSIFPKINTQSLKSIIDVDDAGFPVRLTKQEIDKQVQQNQIKLLPKRQSKIIYADVNMLGANSPIEDRYIAKELPSGYIFGILDGHWDTQCVSFVEKCLPTYILSSISNSFPNTHESIPNALKRAFIDLDKDLLNLPIKLIPNFENISNTELDSVPHHQKQKIAEELLPALTGSCAVLAYITNDKIYIANAGDSRAVLGIKSKSTWKCIPLTTDHQPSNPAELLRLQTEHPGEPNVAMRRTPNGPLRVIGGMMPSRAFGDGKFKWPLSWQQKIDTLLRSSAYKKHSFRTMPHCLTPPYMTAEPEISECEIAQNSFLVIASDGVFDRLSNEEVVDAVSQYISNSSKRKIDAVDIHFDDHEAVTSSSNATSKLLKTVRDKNAAAHVIRTALAGGKGEEEVERMLNLPKESRRKFRDDMSCIVVFFEGFALKAEKGSIQQIERVEVGG